MNPTHKITTALLSFSLLFGTAAASLDDFNDREDIPSWAGTGIGTLVNMGILKGNSDGTFRPEAQINRAEFTKILTLATGTDLYFPLHSSFSDVKDYDWFFPYIETAKRKGWVKGYADGTFRPGNKINRAEATKIISLAFGLEPEEKENNKESEWYEKYFNALESNKLMAYGLNIANVHASGNPSRAEISEQIYRFLKYTGRISPYDVVVDPQKPKQEEPKQKPKTTPTPPTTTGNTYQYTETNPLPQTIEANAGELAITKNSIPKRIVKRNTQNISALSLRLTAKNGPVKVNAFQIRRIGNGSYSDFSKIWVDRVGTGMTKLSPKVVPTQDLVTLTLNNQITIPSGQSTDFIFRTDLSSTGNIGSSNRWTLFLGEWISSNTTAKVGFFPFGGVDIQIK